MQVGYVMCTKDRSKVLCVEKEPKGLQLLDAGEKENLNKALCLRGVTAIKSFYLRLKEKKFVEELDIVDIQELYRRTDMYLTVCRSRRL